MVEVTGGWIGKEGDGYVLGLHLGSNLGRMSLYVPCSERKPGTQTRSWIIMDVQSSSRTVLLNA